MRFPRSIARRGPGRTLAAGIPFAWLLMLSACDSSTDSVAVQVPAVTFEAVGDAIQLEANLSHGTALPEWESLNPEVVTVTRAGMAVSVAPGTAKVVARVRSGEGEGTVTVLPHVSVEVTGMTREDLGDGTEQVRLQLNNTGGRGFYRVRVMRDPSEPEGEHTVIMDAWNDFSVTTGANYWFQFSVSAPADWVLVYSRSPHSEEYRRTACVRFDGGDCPLPPVT